MGIVFICLVPGVIFLGMFLIKWIPFKEMLISLADKPFICPNCGCKFYVKWYQLYFKHYSVYAVNSAKFKCPSCGEVDMCKHDDN